MDGAQGFQRLAAAKVQIEILAPPRLHSEPGSYRWRASTSSSGATVKLPPSGPVEQTAEQRWGVKARKAQPEDAAVQSHQGYGRAIPDQPMSSSAR